MSRAKTIFREEALAHHAGGQEGGDVLRFDPRWLRASFVLLVAGAVAAIVFSFCFSIDEYAAGPAVVRVEGRRVVTASTAGSIESLDVKPGQRVDAGAVLVRLSTVDEQVELRRASSELDFLIVRSMVDPNDVVAKQSLASVRARRDAARNSVEAKTIRAPIAGTVSDVRVKPGTPVVPGEVLCAVVPNDVKEVSLIAMVSADYRPMLKNGLTMRFELDGFRYEYADVVVEEVSAEAIGPSEVQRFLGNERGDSVRLDPGAKVFVTGKLPTSTFTSEGQPYGYFDGLTGNAEVRVRREPIIVTLIPALRQVFP